MSILTRRRFLAVSAAALAAPAYAEPVRWQGHALGAEISLSLYAPEALTKTAIQVTRSRLRQVEQLFSLYDSTSVLSRLNRTGRLSSAPGLFQVLCNQCSRVHRATEGVFDPTIQPLWQALAAGRYSAPARALIGWTRAGVGPDIHLAPGQQITFNGIAQGFATDLIRADLARIGLARALINIGEFAAIGGPFTLGLADPAQGLFATRRITERAIATSSPGAMLLSGASHIQHPRNDRSARWSTVSVEADKAAIADAASTAFAVMTRPEIEQAQERLSPGIRVTLLSHNGDLLTL
ncbi:FAD:protein FMN transferase [Roseovarius sp. 2305UL8-3]|uniref:FAD:protein FMN transferase n=1 Tax=Roseovarius conchicola TaxID=3121636 RepID=UPI0035275F29